MDAFTAWLDVAWDSAFALTASAWAALAAWVAVGVGLGTVLVSFRYARKQVEQAKLQLNQSESARVEQAEASEAARRSSEQASLSQSRDAERARLQQAEEAQKLREEQAQPNVVMYAEPNTTHWGFLELVVKNFGLTPAYDIRLAFDDEPTVAPFTDLSTGEEVSHLNYPRRIPLLAPNQEWRTNWDSTGRRNDADATSEEKLKKTFEGTVSYKDSRGKSFINNAILDWSSFDGTTVIDTYTMHDLVNRVEKQNALIGKAVDNLAHFATEHRGIWVYTGDGAQESSHRTRDAEQRRQIIDHRREQMRNRRRQNEANPPSGDETPPHSTPETRTSEPEPPVSQGG